jgi:hypothetical protein
VRPLAPFLIAAALAVGAVGCGDDSGPSEAAATTTSSTTPTDTGGIDPLEGAGTKPVKATAEGFETALLERVAVARHEGYDRVVFQFRNALPGYRIEYTKPPIRQDGSGEVVDVAGKAILLIRMEPASGFDLSVPEGKLVYTGPRRISGASAGASVIREAVQIGDFEAVLVWAIGLDDRVDFRVSTLDGPPRVVVDFRNH